MLDVRCQMSEHLTSDLPRHLTSALPQRPRQRKEHVLVGGRDGLDAHRIALGEGRDDLLHQNLRRRGTGGDADAGDRAKHRPIDFLRAFDQRRARAAGALGNFSQALRVGGIRRADHQHGVHQWRDLLDHFLPVGGGVTNVLFMRSVNTRKTRLERRHDVGGVIDRQRRLGHVGEVAGVAGPQAGHLGYRLHQGDRAGGELPDRADHFRMTGMTNQHDLAPAFMMDLRLAVDLRHQGTGGIEGEEVALLAPAPVSISARHGRRKSPGRRYRESRRAPPRTRRPCA